MAARIRKVACYDTTIRDVPGEAYRVLSLLAQEGVDLMAFQAVPMGPDTTRITMFTDGEGALPRVAESAGLVLSGPQYAFLVQGDDEMGALARIHKQIYDAEVNVFASWGVTDGQGGFGYVLYVRREAIDKAAAALGL